MKTYLFVGLEAPLFDINHIRISKMRVAVIGGGPAGLVTLKYLITAHEYHAVEPIKAQLFEAKDSIAGTFRYRVYEDAEARSHPFFRNGHLTSFSLSHQNTSQPSLTFASPLMTLNSSPRKDSVSTLRITPQISSYGRTYPSIHV